VAGRSMMTFTNFILRKFPNVNRCGPGRGDVGYFPLEITKTRPEW
jgi:hypothetical protein